MNLLVLAALFVSTALCVQGAPTWKAGTQLEGYDTYGYYDVNWAGFARNNTKFAYIVATDSIANIVEPFPTRFKDAKKVGLYAGAVHIGSPYSSSGADQARYFLAHGGKWRGDGKTLPGALSMQFAASRASCYGQTPDQLKSWIWDFSKTYKKATGRRPVIKTNNNFWTQCLNSPTEFAKDHKLWLVTYPVGEVGQLPAGWSTYTFLQYKDLGTSPSGTPIGYLDKFNGDKAALKKLVRGW